MPEIQSDGIETTPPPAVSSLRSRFEKLAADSSAPVPTSPLKPLASLAHLTVASPDPTGLRSRQDHEPELSNQFLHPASSSSDLKTLAKRPPPPTPLRPISRAPSPALNRSPLLRPVSPAVTDSDVPSDSSSKTQALARRPPPPPPSQDLSLPRTNAVSSIVKQFGNGSAPLATSPPRPPTSSRPNSHILIDGLPIPTPPELPHAKRPRQSFPPDHSASTSSLLSTHSSSDAFDPFDDIHSDTEPSQEAYQHIAVPPPLPRRTFNGDPPLSHHTPDSSSDSLASSNPVSSRTSSDDDRPPVPSSARPPSSPRPSLVPPRPPPRTRVTIQTTNIPSSSSVPSLLSAAALTPPPLPARKGLVEDQQSRNLPQRTQTMNDLNVQQLQPGPSTAMPERKQFGTHLPPPTRMIAPGDKLPPPRRVNSNEDSSSDEEDEEDSKVKVDLPDASRASRKPPVVDCFNYSEFNILVPAYTSSVTVSGRTVVVMTSHHLRIHDLSVSEAPIWHLEPKNDFKIKVKDFKMTSVEFRPTTSVWDRGAFLWIGSKDGHIIELNVHTAQVIAVRLAVHAQPITHMFRHERSMVTYDAGGKVLVWSPPDHLDLDLNTHQPRVVRIADKQEFAKLIKGQLWTSTRDPSAGGTGPGTSKGPYIRVFDVFTPGSAGRSLLPTEHLGAVTAATMVPNDPTRVYIAHEGGNISVWALGNGDGPPHCEEVVKVSTSDILSLEGVNDRLWAGGRAGTISAFDVSSKPWAVTNLWMAHQSLPVLRLAVDTWSMEKLNRLMVFSVGRDEKLRFWDGLLGVDWIEQEMLKRASEYSTFCDMTALIVSWNVDAAKPEALVNGQENIDFLDNVLKSVPCPDFIVFGMQELIDLESRKMAAKTVILGGKNKAPDGAISQKVTSNYKRWTDRLTLSVRLAMPADVPYTMISSSSLVGLFSCTFVKNTEMLRLKHVNMSDVKRGMGGRYGNKGGIISRFVVDDTSICFINCHLAAGQHQVRQRNADAASIVDDGSLEAQPNEVDAYISGGDGSMVKDHEIVFMNGDMNYRIDQRRETVIAAIKAGDLQQLLIHDQLRKEMKFNRAFRLRTFQEGQLDFAPTYKYDRRSDEYDTSEKARTPAWCDRVLWWALVPDRVEQLHYRRWEPNVSDHRPISAAFKIKVKSVEHEAKARLKSQVQEQWKSVEKELLASALQYYIDQKMI